jgi:hypothetical protein
MTYFYYNIHYYSDLCKIGPPVIYFVLIYFGTVQLMASKSVAKLDYKFGA